MTRRGWLSVTMIAAVSAMLGGGLYWREGPAWADGLPLGGSGSVDGGTYPGGYGRPDGAARKGAYGGGYPRDGGTYRAESGRADGGGDGAVDGPGSGAAGIEANPYNPRINPRNFVSRVSNRYFRLRPGTVFIYEKRIPGGTERTEIEVTGQRRRVLGVLTTVVRHRGWLNGQLKEDARDWYAQDRRGNVWYFGEEVDNYENGRLKDHSGSWEAGVNGAKPGIVMLRDPIVGLTYRQEYYRGQAEDMGTVIALNRTVRTAAGTFRGCLQTRDWSLIDTTVREYKYYCPQVGFLAFEEAAPRGGDSSQLVGVSTARVRAFNARGNRFKARRSAFARRY
jgi:hypothetical protein